MSEQAEAASPASAASPQDAGTPQIDTDAVTMEQLEQLFEGGSAELPVKSGGEENKKGQEAAPAKPKAQDPPAKVDEPAKAGDEPPAKVEGAEEVVEETRTDEEIETAVTTAVEAVKAEGGDQAAQDAAAEVARQPVKTEAAPAKVDPPVKPAAAKEDPDAEKSRRFRVKNPLAQAALEVYKSFENTDTPITLAEAERRVRGGDEPVKETKVDVPETALVVSNLETEVAALKEKLTAAGADEGLFNADIAKLQIDLSEKTADLKLAQRDLRDEKEAAQQEAEETEAAFKRTVAGSRAKAIELYPDVANDETPLGKAVAERIEAMRDKAHPDHQLLFIGSAPETITRLVATELGIQPATKAKAKEATPPVKKEATPPKPKKVDPASGALSSAAAAASKPEDAKKAVEYLKSDKATLEDLDNAFGARNPLQAIAV